MCCKGDNSVLLETDQLVGKVLTHIRESKTIRGKGGRVWTLQLWEDRILQDLERWSFSSYRLSDKGRKEAKVKMREFRITEW